MLGFESALWWFELLWTERELLLIEGGIVGVNGLLVHVVAPAERLEVSKLLYLLLFS